MGRKTFRFAAHPFDLRPPLLQRLEYAKPPLYAFVRLSSRPQKQPTPWDSPFSLFYPVSHRPDCPKGGVYFIMGLTFSKKFPLRRILSFQAPNSLFPISGGHPSESSAAGQQAYCCPAPRSKTASFLELNASNKRKLSIFTLSNRRARPPPRTTGKPVSPQRGGLVRLLRQRECPPLSGCFQKVCAIYHGGGSDTAWPHTAIPMFSFVKSVPANPPA